MKIGKRQFNKVRKTFSKESLSRDQKNTMLSSILGDTIDMIILQPIVSPLSTFCVFARQKTFAVAGIALLVIVSDTTYASAHSLPGDLLYSVKTKVIEPINLAVRVSEESKNEYKLSLLQKRVDEVEKLEKKGKLNNYSQRESSRATSSNVKKLEKSAIFDTEGKNNRMSETVRNYNSIIKKDLRIETNINTDSIDTVKADLKINLKAKTDSNLKDEIKEDYKALLQEIVDTQNKDKVEDDTDNNDEEEESLNDFLVQPKSSIETNVKIPGL